MTLPYELPPLPNELSSLPPTISQSIRSYAHAAIEGVLGRRGEPVAWQNRHKPVEIMQDDDLDPAWRDMYRPLYAFEPLCDSCNDVGVFTTDNEGPYDCYDCGRKAPQPAEPYVAPMSDKPVCGAQNGKCETQPANPAIKESLTVAEPVREVSDLVSRLRDADRPLLQQGKFSDVRNLLREAADFIASYGAAQPAASAEPDCSHCGGFGSITGDDPDTECDVCNGTGKAAPVAAQPSVPVDIRQEVIETLEMILAADWRKWEELASPDEFVRWAKSRANYALSIINEAPQPAEPVKVPSAADLMMLAKSYRTEIDTNGFKHHEFDEYGFARALLARYGQPAQPLSKSVAKRLAVQLEPDSEPPTPEWQDFPK